MLIKGKVWKKKKRFRPIYHRKAYKMDLLECNLYVDDLSSHFQLAFSSHLQTEIKFFEKSIKRLSSNVKFLSLPLILKQGWNFICVFHFSPLSIY